MPGSGDEVKFTASPVNDRNSDKATCALCHRQVARYTCPTCNVPYCSLTCFRSEKHDQCTEGFYKRELESEIRTKPSATTDERKRMLEMLRRLEEEEGAGDDESDEDDDFGDEKHSLATRLSAINIGSASSSQLWGILNPAQREAFVKMINEPHSAEGLLGVLNDQDVVPWWERESFSHDGSEIATDTQQPEMCIIPETLLSRQTSGLGPPLLYNICSALVAYAFVTRFVCISPLSSLEDGRLSEDSLIARQLMRELVPHVTEKKSRTLFTCMDAVVLDLWPRLVDSGKTRRTTFHLFVRDAAALMRPKHVVALGEGERVGNSDPSQLEMLPQSTTLRALSDLVMLFSTGNDGKQKTTPASAKLVFYAAQVASVPTPILSAFSAEVQARARALEAESMNVPDTRDGNVNVENSKSRMPDGLLEAKPLVEEI